MVEKIRLYPTPPKYDMMDIIESFHNDGSLSAEKYEAITYKMLKDF